MTRTASIVLASSLLACRDPTQAELVIVSFDVSCAALAENGIAVRVGTSSAHAASVDPVTTTYACTSEPGGGGTVGNLTAIPSGAKDSPFGVEITAGVNIDVNSCRAAADKCIVARRQLSYIPNHTLTLPIRLRQSCLGRVCDPSSTCYDGSCVPADINPQLCLTAAGCNDDALIKPKPPKMPKPNPEPVSAGWITLLTSMSGNSGIHSLVIVPQGVLVGGHYGNGSSTLGTAKLEGKHNLDPLIALVEPVAGDANWAGVSDASEGITVALAFDGGSTWYGLVSSGAGMPMTKIVQGDLADQAKAPKLVGALQFQATKENLLPVAIQAAGGLGPRVLFQLQNGADYSGSAPKAWQTPQGYWSSVLFLPNTGAEMLLEGGNNGGPISTVRAMAAVDVPAKDRSYIAGFWTGRLTTKGGTDVQAPATVSNAFILKRQAGKEALEASFADYLEKESSRPATIGAMAAWRPPEATEPEGVCVVGDRMGTLHITGKTLVGEDSNTPFVACLAGTDDPGSVGQVKILLDLPARLITTPLWVFASTTTFPRIATDLAGNVYIAASFENSVAFSDINANFTAKGGADGGSKSDVVVFKIDGVTKKVKWARTLPANEGQDLVFALAVAGDDDLYVAGSQGYASTMRGFLWHITPTWLSANPRQ